MPPRLNITIGHPASAHGSDHSSYSDADDSSGTGVHLSPASALGSQDYPESLDDWVLPYPEELGPSDSASRPRTSNQHRPIREEHPRPTRRPSERNSRERSLHRSLPRSHRQAQPIPTESVDSADEWPGYAREQLPLRSRGHDSWSYAMRGPSPTYPQSFASGYSYGAYPGPGSGPPGNQLIPVPSQAGYSYQSQPYPIPPSSHSPGYYSHAGEQLGATGIPSRSVPPYAAPDMIPYGQGGHYFPGAGHPYAVAQGMVPPMYYPYNMVHSPPLAPTPPPRPDSSKTDEQFARLERLLLEEKAQRDAKEAAAQKAAEEQEAKAAADKKAAEEAAAVQKAADEAAAKAAAAAKEEAEKKAAEEAAAAKKAAEEAAKKAAEEAAAAAAAVAKPPPEEKLKPIKFKDAVGRKFSFPFHLCKTWQGIEGLIRQAFLHVDVIGQHVAEGHYDLIGPNNEIILPQVWETMVEPDWNITMHMWPMPEPPPPPPPPAEPAPPPPPPVPEVMPQVIVVDPPKRGKGGERASHHHGGKQHRSPPNFMAGPPPHPAGILPPPPPPPPNGGPGPSDGGPEILVLDPLGDAGGPLNVPSGKKPQASKVSPLLMWTAGRPRPAKKARERPEAQHAVVGRLV